MLAIEQELRNAAEADTYKKKRIAPKQSLDTDPASMRSSASTFAQQQRTISPKPRQTTSTASSSTPSRPPKVALSDSESDAESHMPGSSDGNESDVPGSTSRPTLTKRPSIVREDQETEDGEHDASISSSKRNVRPTSPTPIKALGGARVSGTKVAAPSDVADQGRGNRASSISSEASAPVTPATEVGTSKTARATRVQSMSPTRTKFNPIATTDNLMVRHSPPPRAVSPRKSALKTSQSPHPSSRGLDVSTDRSVSPSEASTTADDYTQTSRKKANRVSFDDGGTVVLGPDPSNDSEPAQPKRTWFKGFTKRKDWSEDEDEIMKPRPMLPSFGSVRQQKRNSQPTSPDRPLVMPGDGTSRPQEQTSPPLFTTATGEVIESPPGISTDHLVGGILAHDSTSETSSMPAGQPNHVTSGINDTNRNGVESVNQALRQSTKVVEDVPEINILQASPNLEQTENNHLFSTTNEEHHPTVTPKTVGLAEPTEPLPVASSMLGGIAENAHHPPAIPEESDDDTDHDSIYSDAAEDFNEAEGDGFLSLDAVVESPIGDRAPGLAITTPPESPTIQLSHDSAVRHGLTRQSSEPKMDEGWIKAQQYWTGLSAEKRHEKELEALKVKTEAESSASTPAPAPRRIKKKDNVGPPSHPERSYMIKPGSKVSANGAITYESPKRAPATDTQMRKSMRTNDIKPARATQAPDETHMRKSMRAGNHDTSQPRATKARPVSLPAKASEATHTRPVSASVAEASVAMYSKNQRTAPSMQRKASAESDSSFRKARPTSENISLRRSMRGSDSQGQTSPSVGPSTARLTLRSLSPVNSLRRPAAPSNGASQPSSMRGTMRNPSAGSRTLRGPPARARSPLRIPIPGFGRSTDSPKSVKQGPKPSKQRSSRFADSSDEDEGPSFFSSRYADSSDEEDYTPVELPKLDQKITDQALAIVNARYGRTVEAPTKKPMDKESPVLKDDSDDLEDSDDGNNARQVPVGAAQNNVTAPVTSKQKSAQGQALSSGSLRRSGSGRGTLGYTGTNPTIRTSITSSSSPKSAPRKRGLMSSILGRRKNNRHDDSPGRIRKIDGDSGARRDTPLERSKSEIERLRRGEEDHEAEDRESALVSNLQKRKQSYGSTTSSSAMGTTTLKSKDSSWPLPGNDDEAGDATTTLPSQTMHRPQPELLPPTVLASVEEQRPFSADGMLTSATKAQGDKSNDSSTLRPEMNARRATSTGLEDFDLKASVLPDLKRPKKKGWRRLLGRG